MDNKRRSRKMFNHSWKYLKIGALIGAVLGAIFGVLQQAGMVYIPGIEHLIAAMPFGIVLSSIIFGIAVGCIVGEVVDLYQVEK